MTPRKLRQFIDDHFKRNVSAFARAIDRSPAYVHLLLAGKRPIPVLVVLACEALKERHGNEKQL
jgi:geranylgeranyl pyrophosphate synthase